MITVIDGDTNTFRAIAYGQPDPLTMDWCRQRHEERIQTLDPFVQQAWQQSSNTVFGNIDYQAIANLSKAMSNQLDGVWVHDTIMALDTLAQLQAPPPIMVKWVMANPNLRELYHDQLIAGYDEYYVDPEPGKRGEDHYYYRRAVNGLFLENTNGELEASEWFENISDPSDVLDIVDQCSIQSTWASAIKFINERASDPTSMYNAQL